MATFLALVEGLIGDSAEKAAYAADPDNYLSSHGFGDFDPEDVSTALAHTADAFPPRLAAVIDPEAGLAPVAEVELGQLGLSGFDEYAPPLDDDVGGANELGADAHTGDVPDGADGPQPLHRDVDIDLDGDGIPDAPAVNEPGAEAHTDARDGADDGRDDGDTGPGVLDGDDGDELAAPSFATATDPFNDPWSDPGLGLDDDAPWMDASASRVDLETVSEPDDDILDDVDEHLGQ